MAAGRKAAADQARAANTQMWMGLAGDTIGFVGGLLTGGNTTPPVSGGSSGFTPMPKPSLPPVSLFPK